MLASAPEKLVLRQSRVSHTYTNSYIIHSDVHTQPSYDHLTYITYIHTYVCNKDLL